MKREDEFGEDYILKRMSSDVGLHDTIEISDIEVTTRKIRVLMCRKFWTFMWTKLIKKIYFLEGFFLSSEKLNFEKEKVIFLILF